MKLNGCSSSVGGLSETTTRLLKQPQLIGDETTTTDW